MLDLASKICKSCQVDKSLDEYTYHKDKRWRAVKCKSCERIYQRDYKRAKAKREGKSKYGAKYLTDEAVMKRRYGLTQALVDAQLKAIGGKCEICRTPLFSKGYHLDHCHKTGAPRGILCPSCNQALGKFEKKLNKSYGVSKKLLKQYLRRTSQEQKL